MRTTKTKPKLTCASATRRNFQSHPGRALNGNIRASATQITYWGSLLLLSTTACSDRSNRSVVAKATQTTSVTATAKADSTRFEIRSGMKLLGSITVGRDSTVAQTAVPSTATVVGEIPGVAVVIVDTYASKPGGMSYCQAGEEQFLRVIAVTRSPLTETSITKIASCRENIELASPGVEWRADSSLVRIHWLTRLTSSTGSETRSLRIGGNGVVEVLKP